jgi:hypothetical protein
MPTHLIFVEGMVGAGKSTTARKIAEWLEVRGESARAYHEGDDDNPIRTKGTDLMRANHPQAKPLPDVGPDGLAIDPRTYGPQQWRDLAGRCQAGESTVVLESRYIQNSVQPRFMAGAPVEKVYEGFERIEALVSPAEPLLIYLRTSDIGRVIRTALAQRGDPWASWFKNSFSSLAWSRERGLSGEEAILAFYEVWEPIAARLCEMHTGPRFLIEDAHDDWPAALERIFTAVRPASGN